MPRYLLIESRDPFDSNDTRFCCDLATQLAAAKHEVTVFLVQNGVLAVRKNGRDSYLGRLVGAGITLLADDFSLCERGIQPSELHAGIQQSGMEKLVEMLVQENAKAIWH